MDIPWHDFTDAEKDEPVSKASLKEKASVIGRVGMMFLSCGTGAWRVRSSMNTMSECMGLTCTADIGLMSINYTCFDGEACFSQSLCLTNTGVNNSKLTRLENFINDFVGRCDSLTCEQVHNELDDIEKIHGLYSPPVLGLAAALACGAFTFLLGGGLTEMICAFFGAGIGNYVRSKFTKHHLTLVLGIVASVSAACLSYAGLFELAKILFNIKMQHEAGYICAMLLLYLVFRSSQAA